MKTPVIKVNKLTKKFGQGMSEQVVLRGIDLEILAGEYAILFGPSGCGKSTLLNIISGLEVPTTGEVYIRGEKLAKLSTDDLAYHRNTKIGIIFQQFNVLKSLNVLQNVALPGLFQGQEKKRRLNRARHLLEIFGIGKFGHLIPTELSGGQQQRVAIARALMNNPWILIVDEPTGNLDTKAADEVMKLLESLNKKSKRTILLVTHNPDYLKFADRILYMKDGQIVREKKKRGRKPGLKDTTPSEEIKI